jgi:LysR family nitrogen assimilation transcriptional regulator
MDLKQLKYFISIADFGSMTRASESLNIAQPALTQQVAKLEADLRPAYSTAAHRASS